MKQPEDKAASKHPLEKITLTSLTPEFHNALIELAADFYAAGEQRYRDVTPDMTWEQYVALLRRLESAAHDEGLPPGRVPQTAYWLVRDGKVLLGSSHLRPRLTPMLEYEGGHIGYAIRPSERGKGYATLLLALTLEKAREIGLPGVLITCDDDNIASARVIEKNGGQLLNKVISKISGKPVRRYWIDLEAQRG